MNEKIGVEVKFDMLFQDNWKQTLSFEELKSRRNVILKEVDKQLK